MVRVARVAVPAVLALALSAGLQANAAPAPSSLDRTVHLEPSRMFDRSAESILAGIRFVPFRRSLVSDDIFNIAPPDVVLTREVPIPTAAIGQVNLNEIGGDRFGPVAFHFNPQAHLAPRGVSLPNDQVSVYAPPSIAPINEEAPIEPLPGFNRARVAHASLSYNASEPVHFGAYAPYLPSLRRSVTANVTVPVRVGNVHFAGVVEGSHAQTLHSDALRAMQFCGTADEAAACPYLSDSQTQRFAAGTNFGARVGREPLNLQFSGSIEHLSTANSAIFQYVPVDPDAQLTSARFGVPDFTTPMLYYPGVTDLVKHGINASVALPLTRRVTLGLQYDYQHYQGDYATTFQPGLDATKNTYLGNVTYQLPHTSSAITLSARQYVYQDTFAPSFNITQTRADLDFTVKF